MIIDTITITSSPPIDGLAISVRLVTTQKNDYEIIVFTDCRGNCTVEKEEILKWCDGQRSVAIMDYEDPRRVIAGEINVRVMDDVAILRAIDAYITFVGVAYYPPNYISKLQIAQGIARSILPTSVQLTVSTVVAARKEGP